MKQQNNNNNNNNNLFNYFCFYLYTKTAIKYI